MGTRSNSHQVLQWTNPTRVPVAITIYSCKHAVTRASSNSPMALDESLNIRPRCTWETHSASTPGFRYSYCRSPLTTKRETVCPYGDRRRVRIVVDRSSCFIGWMAYIRYTVGLYILPARLTEQPNLYRTEPTDRRSTPSFSRGWMMVWCVVGWMASRTVQYDGWREE